MHLDISVVPPENRKSPKWSPSTMLLDHWTSACNRYLIYININESAWYWAACLTPIMLAITSHNPLWLITISSHIFIVWTRISRFFTVHVVIFYFGLLFSKARKKDILASFMMPKWPIRPKKRFHLKWCLIFENNKSK